MEIVRRRRVRVQSVLDVKHQQAALVADTAPNPSLIVDDKEEITEQIARLQGKYTLAVKSYAVLKNENQREQAKALIAKLGKQIDELKKN